MKVIFAPEIRIYFQELSELLWEQDYFGFEDQAIRYVRELFYDIQDNLPSKLKKKAPKHFHKYGKNLEYAIFPKNKNTTWYVFFSTYEKEGELFYLVNYISNNHVIAKYF